MVNSRLIAIAYFCFFMGVYLSSIAYSMLPTIFESEIINNLPQTTYTNETFTAISSISGSNIYMGFGLILVGVVIMFIFGCMNTFGAFNI